MNHSTPIEEEELVLTFAHRMRMELFQSRLQRPAWKRSGSEKIAGDIHKALATLDYALGACRYAKGEELRKYTELAQELCVKIGICFAMLHDCISEEQCAGKELG